MFENTDKDEPPRRDDGEPLLQAHVVGENVRIMANRRGFTLRATQKRATNGTFVFCDRADRIAPKALVISYTGRPRVTQTTRRGDPYNCAD
jgi:type IV fimbrial biogenesis protein FimT